MKNSDSGVIITDFENYDIILNNLSFQNQVIS